jgi:hypothetical protein
LVEEIEQFQNNLQKNAYSNLQIHTSDKNPA